MDDQNILAGYIREDEFAAKAGISRRTASRYRNQVDGLPFLEFGGWIYIPISAAREWLQARIKHPNQRRKAA
ncbi:hypothetical protein SAMN05519103_04561 [Rhizobiales bacterium GAS113]|nr:hypothetical protein SAMN05519103_04561 [Rhizobiales bacterium GAS113]